MAASGTTQARGEHKTVLVVDDDPAALDLVTALLQDASYQVRARSTPFGAMQGWRDGCVDAVVLDLNMPGFSGEELAAKLRKDGQGKGVPIVFLSASPVDALYDAARTTSGAAVVHKSRMREELVATVTTALRRSGAHRIPHAHEEEADKPVGEAVDAVRSRLEASFLQGLPAQLDLARRLWKSLGETPANRRPLLDLVHLLKGEAAMLGLQAHALLLTCLDDVLERVLEEFSEPPASVMHAVSRALHECDDMQPHEMDRAQRAVQMLRWLTTQPGGGGSPQSSGARTA